jgi:Fe-S-cluster containining protein
MNCRLGCGACCIAPSISSPIPGMPQGKPAGVRFDPYLLQGELLDEFMAIVMTYADSSELITGRPAVSVAEKHASFRHYMLGTLALIGVAWLVFMILSHLGYINFSLLYYQ